MSSSTGNGGSSASPPGSPAQRPTGPPLEALQRFATDLRSDKRQTPFLEINLKRVNAFIQKVELDQEASDGEAQRRFQRRLDDRARKVGVYEYPPPRSHHADLAAMQHLPETSPALGVRSRFGEGDGSFFDRFVASDELIQQPMLPPTLGTAGADGHHCHDSLLPGQGGNILSPTTGFRRHLQAIRSGAEPASPLRIKPYAERRRERLQREGPVAGTAGAPSPSSAASPSPASSSPSPRALQPRPPRPENSSPSSPNLTLNSSPNPAQKEPILPPLSEADRAKYFGDTGRSAFFVYYKQLARQRRTALALTPNPSTAQMWSLVDDGEGLGLGLGLGAAEEEGGGALGGTGLEPGVLFTP